MLRLIFGDQLIPPSQIQKKDPYLMLESPEFAKDHHQLKLAFFLSNMQHYAEELRQASFPLHYISLNKSIQNGGYWNTLSNFLDRHRIKKISLLEIANS